MEVSINAGMYHGQMDGKSREESHRQVFFLIYFKNISRFPALIIVVWRLDAFLS